jgi:hypothetical protein
MTRRVMPLDFSRLKVFPLRQRESLLRLEEVLLDPEAAPAALPTAALEAVREAARAVARACAAGATVLLIYGAHLVRNGAGRLVGRLLEQGWLTHLATNGAGAIHDWEFAWLGATTESVARNVARGCFGTWDETATFIHLAVLTGALDGLGYGQAVGRLIAEEGLYLPSCETLQQAIAADPLHPQTAARAELLQVLRRHPQPAGWLAVPHPWKETSFLAQAYRRGIPLTVHPGIGYDIIANHPIFNGAALGRAAEWDFKLFGSAVEGLDGGVVLNVGSAVMGPQIFEKSLSCVNNLRLHSGRDIVRGHQIYVVDLQENGGWDWTQGEPPKTHPAYYLRFCKSFSRMGGQLRYVQCDHVTFLHHLYHELARC